MLENHRRKIERERFYSKEDAEKTEDRETEGCVMRDRSRYLPAKDRTKIILSAGLHRVLNVYREHGGGRCRRRSRKGYEAGEEAEPPDLALRHSTLGPH